MHIMDITAITSEQVIIRQWRFLLINATIVYTWLVMVLLVAGSWLVTRQLSSAQRLSRWQNLLEVSEAATGRQD